MLNLYCKFQALRATRDQGVTAVEYGLILAAIVIVIGTLVFTLGGTIATAFTNANCDVQVKGCK
jgi:pilus assembly protein Flp/PilA